MYWFKVSEKENLLQGRKISYIANKILFCGYTYLVEILKGTKGCSRRMAKDIITIANNDAKIEDYFELRER